MITSVFIDSQSVDCAHINDAPSRATQPICAAVMSRLCANDNIGKCAEVSEFANDAQFDSVGVQVIVLRSTSRAVTAPKNFKNSGCRSTVSPKLEAMSQQGASPTGGRCGWQ